jgi:hypothetical protein
MLDAEEQGLREIDEALAWIVTRARYGAALLPDGAPQHFKRVDGLVEAHRSQVVLVRALGSQRSWSRETGGPRTGKSLVLDRDHAFLAGSEALHIQDDRTRQAVLALARATTEVDPLARVGALWEAVEFFVGRTTVPKLFTKEDRQAIVAALPETLSARQRARVERLVDQQLNDLPLRTKLEAVLDREHIPHSDDEIETLFGLRVSRNKALHGQGRVAPTTEELQQAMAFVARMLVHRLWAKGHQRSSQQRRPAADPGSVD